MAGSPYGVTPAGPWAPPPSGVPIGSPQKPSRAIVLVALGVALVSLLVAIASWVKPTSASSQSSTESPSVQTYSDQEIQQSISNMCAAHKQTATAISTAGSARSDDPNVKFTIAVNARLAILANANLLWQTLSANPQLPPEVTKVFSDMADAYSGI